MRRLLLLLALRVLLAGQELSLSTPSSSVARGSNALIDVSLSHGAVDISAIQWTLDLSFLGNAAIKAGTTTTDVEKRIKCSKATGTCMIWGRQRTLSQGPLARLTIAIPGNAPLGPVTVRIVGALGSSWQGNAVAVAPGDPLAITIRRRNQ